MFTNPVTISAALIALLVALLLSGGATGTARAQTPNPTPTPSVEVFVDRTDMTTMDVLTLTLKIEGVPNVSPPPPPPSVIGLVLIGRRNVAKSSFVNGVMVSQFEFQFKYRAARTGKIEIQPRKVVIGGDVYVTDPIEINVTPAPIPSGAQLPTLTQPSSLAGQDLFMEADVDNPSPYIGEQIVHAIRYYSTTNTSGPVLDPPDYAGFWNPEETLEGGDVVTAAGRRYNVIETRTILFPTLAGSITIEPTTATGVSGIPSAGRVNLATRQIALNVKPLPPNDPGSFTGAVGKYRVEAGIDTREVSVGEPIVLTVEISGQGNIELLPAPKWPEIPGWRAFDNDVSFTESVVDDKMQGTKTFKRMLVPDAPGSYDLPPIEYAYFDPDLEEYVEVTAASFTVEAIDAPGAGPADSPAAAATVAEEPEPDIRYIKPVPGSMRRGGDSPVSGVAFRALWIAPLAALAALIAWLLLARRVGAFSGIGGRRDDEPGAGELALAQLAQLAKTEPGASSADAAGLALRAYLSAALNAPTGGLTAAAIADRLTARGVSSDTAEALSRTLAGIDEMRFSPRARNESEESGESGEVGREVAELVRRLDEELG